MKKKQNRFFGLRAVLSYFKAETSDFKEKKRRSFFIFIFRKLVVTIDFYTYLFVFCNFFAFFNIINYIFTIIIKKEDKDVITIHCGKFRFIQR